MGEQSSGKSSVVEGFVGQKFNFISDGIATKVPLILSLLSNASYDHPMWELRVDGMWKEMALEEVKKHVSYVNGMPPTSHSLFDLLSSLFPFSYPLPSFVVFYSWPPSSSHSALFNAVVSPLLLTISKPLSSPSSSFPLSLPS